jgi:tRNA(fMet)-specific endonuclease VapC
VASLVVADTDVLVDFFRGRGPGVELVRSLIVESRLRLTAVTVFELRVGTDFLDRRDRIMRICRSRTLPLDLRSALRGGEVASTLRQRGQDIGFADCLQAGICLRYGMPFATRNRRHFERVDGLELVDLAAEQPGES